jgi:type VI secretion system protein ImpJ
MTRDRKKVVWYEGMTLDPHHFQQWDRYVTGLLNNRVDSLNPFAWGFSRLSIDKDRLANGELVLVDCGGVMPDGLPFNIPARDRLPDPRNVEDVFPAAQEQLGVHLAVPAERTDGANIWIKGRDPRRATRFTSETIALSDENTGVDEREVEVAGSNFDIRFEGEPLETYTTLPLAEINRTVGGGFELNQSFVPPVLQAAASERLMEITRRLLENLVAKSGSLNERREGIVKQRELSPSDVTALGLLSTVNRYIPLFNQYHAQAHIHPERLYTTMLQLAGELSASTADADLQPRDFPVYEHSELSNCFNALDALLHRMLGGAKPSANYQRLSLQRRGENQRLVSVDKDLLHRAQFFLVVSSAEMDEEKLVHDVPTMLRVASEDTLEGVLRSSTRALPLQHTHRLPAGMPIDHQSNYFQMEKRGPFWDAILESGSIALFVPSEYVHATIELVAIEKP